jgi:hypothetical protein
MDRAITDLLDVKIIGIDIVFNATHTIRNLTTVAPIALIPINKSSLRRNGPRIG